MLSLPRTRSRPPSKPSDGNGNVPVRPEASVAQPVRLNNRRRGAFATTIEALIVATTIRAATVREWSDQSRDRKGVVDRENALPGELRSSSDSISSRPGCDAGLRVMKANCSVASLSGVLFTPGADLVTDRSGPRPPKLPESAATPIPASADQIVELSAIAGGLAHEIRNSLSTLRMNLQLLDEDWRRADADARSTDASDTARRSRNRIGTLLKESRRLERILDDFLQFVSKRELKRRPFDLNRLIAELADFYRPQAEAHGVELRTAPSDAPLICEIDVNLMKQAVLNLMINAQQSMSEGGTMIVRLESQSAETARIDVIDTGPGIPSEQLERIFEAYHSTKKAGTGLGLPTARQIVRAHDGRLHVHSEPSKGSCFTILLPRSPTA